ncbi:MAG: DUF4395 domain-containing protein [Acidimicrobiales bacterium]
MALPAFPNPVNELSARLVAGGVVVMALATIVLDLEWMTAVLAYGFVARVLAGPRFSPLALLVTRFVTPALPVHGRLVPGPPKRFAQLLGAVFSVTAAILTFGLDRFDLAELVLAVLLVPASLEAFAGFCVGCQIFGWLMRAGVIPESVCEECSDISRRVGATA